MINDNLINSVFQELLQHKPTLSKFLIEEDEDEETDIRVLADQVVRSYPWPIGVELRRLFSARMRQLDQARLDQILKTVERTMHFLSFTLVLDLYDSASDGRINLSDGFRNEFGKRFLSLSLGDFSWLIRSIGNLFKEENEIFFMPEAKEIFSGGFYKSLDFWITERNDISHHKINLTSTEVERRCLVYEDHLVKLLCKISFLAKYKLVSVSEIKLEKRKEQQPKYHHLIDTLNGSISDEDKKEKVFETYSDSNAVLLLKSLKDPRPFLNLSPLIIDTRSEVPDSLEKLNTLKKDIFLYTRFGRDRLEFVPTVISEKSDLTQLSYYDDLITEFDNLISVLSVQNLSNNLKQ